MTDWTPPPYPTVGRIVHYVSYGTPGGEFTSQCRAAVVTATHIDGFSPARASLAVLNPEGLYFNQELPYSEVHQGGTWHYPERV